MRAWSRILLLIATWLAVGAAGVNGELPGFPDDLPQQLTDAAAESLDGRQGSAIVIDPHTGRVLVLVNEALALQRAYLPGSLFKIVTAAAALEEGLVDEHMTVHCRGQSLFHGQPLYCWYRPGHGEVNIHKALALSCNIYFYQLGQIVGLQHLLNYASRFKLGETTGINRPGEAAGRLPAWVPELEVPKLAVGQSKELTVTPIQVAVLMAAIANGGFLYQPSVLGKDIKAEDFKPVLRGSIELTRALGVIREGLRESADYGTSIASSAGLVGVAGKTGTASQGEGDKTDAWFAGYFPADTPEIALVVFVRSGIGASDAAPIAARIFKRYMALRQASPLPPVGPARQGKIRVRVLSKHHPETLRITAARGKAIVYAEAKSEQWGELEEGEVLRVARRGTQMMLRRAGRSETPASRLWIVPTTREAMLKVSLPGGAVRAYRGDLSLRAAEDELHIVNLVEEVDYLASVVHSEMGEAPLEALKAQALLSRTFLAKRHGQDPGDYDVTDLTEYQSYGGAFSETRLSRQAVEETTGEVLTFQGELIRPLFHSTSGGYTLDAFDVWGREKIPYLAAVQDGEGPRAYGELSPHVRWQAVIAKDAVHRILSQAYGLRDPGRLIEVRKVEQRRHDIENYPGQLELVGPGLKIGTDQFRLDINRVLGWHTIKSNRFRIDLVGSTYTLTGNGLGHGVGMSQWGAKGMAERGYDFRQIVSHYFRGVEITNRSR